MSIRPCLGVALAAALLAESAAPSYAEPSPLPAGSSAWCAPEVEALASDVCHIHGGQAGSRRTLVVFLHGYVPRGTSDQWIQERILLRQAKQNGFEAIFPKAPLGPKGYLWPATVAEQEAVEGGWIASWRAAQAGLERRAGHPFDEVFVVGFSSGAYFASSLALRGKLDFVHGYAVMAGGVAYPLHPTDVPRGVPMFVGICAEDDVSARNERMLKDALVTRGIPYRVDEEPIGHVMSDAHAANALSYLRSVASVAKRN
jgi:predicted esterase